MQKGNNLQIVILVVFLFLLSACSGLYPYKNKMKSNLLVRTKTDSGSFFTRVKARVDIYAVDDECKISYQGTVDLNKKQIRIGIPYNKPAYLDFVFSSSNFLASRRGSTTSNIWLTLRSGYEYVAEATYLDGIYDVIIKERKKGSTAFKELELKDCRAK